MKTKRRRVLYIESPGVVGGTITGLYELVRHLDLNQYEPIILFYYRDHPYYSKFESLGFKVFSLGKRSSLEKQFSSRLNPYQERLARIFWATFIIIRVASLIKQESIDIVHHNNNLPKDRYTVLAAKLANIPQVCHIRTLKPLSTFDRYLASSVDRFIYMSKAIEDLYLHAGIPPRKGQVIYDGFDTREHEINDFRYCNSVRAEFGLTEKEWLISNIGRLDNWKGQDYFIEAIAKVVKLYPNIKALLVGAPDYNTPWNRLYYQKLQQMVKDLELFDNVFFTGYRSDISKIMADSDVIVHSSSQPEPFGRVIVEAMLTKRPVIATAAGGVLDIIEDQVTGILVPPKNVEAMTEMILRLIYNHEEAEIMAKKAFTSAKERFSVEKNIISITQVYRQLLTK